MRQAVATAILSLLPLCAAMGDIYRSVDAQGHVQYSDTPSPGAQLVSSSDPHPASSPAATPPAATSSPPPPPSRNEQISQRIAQQEAAEAVERDTSEAHSKQCKQAQQNYQQSIEARRLFKAGADGERQYLTDDEADQQRVNNRLAMETACGDASDQSAADSDTTASQ
jgi:hypothetical protein